MNIIFRCGKTSSRFFRVVVGMISWMDEHNVVEGGDEFLLEFAFATILAFSERVSPSSLV